MRTRADQIESLRADQQFWRDLAAEVRPERYAEPGPMGDWSFADMAGHLTGWRNRTSKRLYSVCGLNVWFFSRNPLSVFVALTDLLF